MVLSVLDKMKEWVEDLSVKNRTLEEENKTLKLTIVTLTQELEMERMSNGKNSVNGETQVDEINRSPVQRRKVQSESDVGINNGQQIPRASTSTEIVSDRGESYPPKTALLRSVSDCELMTRQVRVNIQRLQSTAPPVKINNDMLQTALVSESPSLTTTSTVCFAQSPVRSDLTKSSKPSKSQSECVNEGPNRNKLWKHVCTICNKRFVTPSKLKIHQVTHEKTKLFVCKFCDCRYARQDKLTEHMKKIHPTQVIHKCPISNCTKTFPTQRLLNSHSLVHNGSSHVCRICDIGFSMKKHLILHNKQSKHFYGTVDKSIQMSQE